MNLIPDRGQGNYQAQRDDGDVGLYMSAVGATFRSK